MKHPTLLIALAGIAVASILPACSSSDDNSNPSPPASTPDASVDSASPNETPDATADTSTPDTSIPFDVSVSCTKPSDCADSGEVCCGSISAGGIASSCQSSCNSGQGQLCASASDCPAGDSCPTIPVVGIGICQPPSEAGVPDAGPDTSVPDADLGD